MQFWILQTLNSLSFGALLFLHRMAQAVDVDGPLPLLEEEDRPDDPPLLVGSNAKLLAAGWAPRIARDEGLRRTYDWWAAQAA